MELKIAIENASGFEWSEITSKKRDRKLCDARAIYCKLRYNEIKHLSMIGKEINRNHATVIHALSVFDTLVSTKDFQFCELLDSVNMQIDPQLSLKFNENKKK